MLVPPLGAREVVTHNPVQGPSDEIEFSWLFRDSSPGEEVPADLGESPDAEKGSKLIGRCRKPAQTPADGGILRIEYSDNRPFSDLRLTACLASPHFVEEDEKAGSDLKSINRPVPESGTLAKKGCGATLGFIPEMH
jgi:hypothetical protein